MQSIRYFEDQRGFPPVHRAFEAALVEVAPEGGAARAPDGNEAGAALWLGWWLVTMYLRRGGR